MSVSVIDSTIDKLEEHGEVLGLRRHRRTSATDDDLRQLMTKLRESDETFGKIESRSATPVKARRQAATAAAITSEEVNCLLSKMRSIEDQQSSHRDTIAMLTSENTQLRTLISSNEEAHNTDRENYFTAAHELKIRSELLETLQEEVTRLVSQVHSLELELSKSEKIRLRQRSEISSHITMRANADSTIQNLEKKLNLNMLATLEETVTNLTVDNTTLAEQHLSLSRQNADLSSTIEHLRQELQSCNHKNSELHETSNACIREYHHMKEKYIELETKTNEKGLCNPSEYHQLVDKHVGLEAAYERLKSEYDALKSEHSASSGMLSKNTRLQTEYHHLEQENNSLRNQRKLLNQQLAMLKEKPSLVPEQVPNYQKLLSKHARLQDDLRRLEEENAALRKPQPNEEVQSHRIKQLEEEKASLRDELRTAKEMLAASQGKCAHLTQGQGEDVTQLKERNEELSHQYDELLSSYIRLRDVKRKDEGTPTLSDPPHDDKVESIPALVSDVPTISSSQTSDDVFISQQVQVPTRKLFSDDLAGTPAPKPQSPSDLPRPCVGASTPARVADDISPVARKYLSPAQSPVGYLPKDQPTTTNQILAPDRFVTQIPEAVPTVTDPTLSDAFLGLVVDGVQVMNVKVGGPAYRCGIRKGAHIISIAGYEIKQLPAIFTEMTNSATVKIITTASPSGVVVPVGRKPRHQWVPSGERHLCLL